MPGLPLASLLRAAARSLLELVYPPRCAACGEPVAEEPFCAVCADALLPVPAGCARCGQPGSDDPCGGCRESPPPFDAVRAGGLFGGPLADAIHALKYGSRPALSRPLGTWLARQVPVPPGAIVVSVPLGRARRVARGYDQAALLADALAQETPPQVGQSRVERARNVARAFQAHPSVSGRDLLLVDDVVTTGATAAAAAGALRAAGARSVVVIALARAE